MCIASQSTSTMSSTCTSGRVRDHPVGPTARRRCGPTVTWIRSGIARDQRQAVQASAADQWEKTGGRLPRAGERGQSAGCSARGPSCPPNRVSARRHRARPAPRRRSVRLGRAADGSRPGRAADGRGSTGGRPRFDAHDLRSTGSPRPTASPAPRSCGIGRRTATLWTERECGRLVRLRRGAPARSFATAVGAERTRRVGTPETQERGRQCRPRSSGASRRHPAESSRPLCGPGTSVARTCQRCGLICEAVGIHRHSSQRREPSRLKRCVNCAVAEADEVNPRPADGQERERGPGPKARPSHKRGREGLTC